MDETLLTVKVQIQNQPNMYLPYSYKQSCTKHALEIALWNSMPRSFLRVKGNGHILLRLFCFAFFAISTCSFWHSKQMEQTIKANQNHPAYTYLLVNSSLIHNHCSFNLFHIERMEFGSCEGLVKIPLLELNREAHKSII